MVHCGFQELIQFCGWPEPAVKAVQKGCDFIPLMCDFTATPEEEFQVRCPILCACHTPGEEFQRCTCSLGLCRSPHLHLFVQTVPHACSAALVLTCCTSPSTKHSIFSSCTALYPAGHGIPLCCLGQLPNVLLCHDLALLRHKSEVSGPFFVGFTAPGYSNIPKPTLALPPA